MKQDTKNVIALIFVIACLVFLAVLLTPPEVIDFIKKFIRVIIQQ